MSQQSITEKSAIIRTETKQYGNTRRRVADILDDINETKANKEEVEAKNLALSQIIEQEAKTRAEQDLILNGKIDSESEKRFAADALKVDKTSTTIFAPNSVFKYAYIFDEANNVRRILAGDLGKNIANSSLTSVDGAGMTQGANYTWNSADYYLTFAGLKDKSADATYVRLAGLNAEGKFAEVGLNAITNEMNKATDSMKDAWRVASRKSNETYSIGQPNVTNLSPVFINKTKTFHQSLTLIGSNLFVDNVTPNASIIMKRVKDINGNAITQEEYPITNYTVLQNLPNMLNIINDWSQYPEGYYQFFVTHNGLINTSSPELIVKSNILETSYVITEWTGSMTNWVIENDNKTVNISPNKESSSGQSNLFLTREMIQNGFSFNIGVSYSGNAPSGNYNNGKCYVLLVGEDGVSYGFIFYRFSGLYYVYEYTSGANVSNIPSDTINFSFFNGILKISLLNKGYTKTFVSSTYADTAKRIKIMGGNSNNSSGATISITTSSLYTL